MLNQKNNAVNPSRDLFVLNKSVNKIRSFNAAIPSDFSTVSKADAARIKKEALELVGLVSYALNQRALKIDVLDDEKKRIVKTKHVSIVYYSLNLIASQLETTARGIAEKLETTEPAETVEPVKAEPETKKVETIPARFAAVNPYSGAPDLIKTVFLHDCKKTIRAYKITQGAAETLEKFAVEFETVLKCRSKFVEKALVIRDKFADWLESEDIFSVELDDREALYHLTCIDRLRNATKDSRSATIRQDVKKLVDEIRQGLTGEKDWKWLNPWIETETDKPAPAPVVETVEENNVEEVEENTVEEVETIDDDDAEETTEEKERALELVATSTVDRLRASVVPWRHLSSDMKTAPRSWDRLRPYSLNNTLIIESTPQTSGARLLITLDRADVKEDGKSVIDWAQYDNTGADVWQPRKFKFIPIKDDAGNIVKDDAGKILATRKVSKYGKVTIHDADRFPWLEKKRAQKYAQLERIVASEIKERNAKRAALLGSIPQDWNYNLLQIVKKYFDGTKLTPERRELGEDIARYFIAARLGFDGIGHVEKNEQQDAARFLRIATQGDKKHGTVGHALQVVLKHVNKCVASILYQSQPTAIKPRAEKPAPAPTVEEVEIENTLVPRNYDAEEIADVIQTLEHLAIVADTLDGRDNEANEIRDAQEKTARKLIEEARENETVSASLLDSYERDIDRINTEYPPTRIEDGLIIRRNPDGSESWLSKNGTEIMRDVTNAN